MLPRYSCAISATPCPSSSMSAGGRNRSDLAVVVGPFRRKDAYDDGGDVVVAAVDVRFLDESIYNPLRLGAGEQQLLDPTVIDHPGQPVTGEEKRIAHASLAVEHIGLDVVRHADAAGDDVALRMTSCLFGRDKTGVNLLLDERVILGELSHLAVTNQVDPGV